MFLIIAFILLLLLPWPASGIAFVACIVVFAGELTFWSRRVRHWRVRTGAETMIGQHGRVVTACRPLGQIAISGELWQARCDGGADVDDMVEVVGRDRLVLVVERDAARSG